jgi:hypothetical protein
MGSSSPRCKSVPRTADRSRDGGMITVPPHGAGRAIRRAVSLQKRPNLRKNAGIAMDVSEG